MTQKEHEPWFAAACNGSYGCAAVVHIHGCFNDDGRCDRPEAHHAFDDPKAADSQKEPT